MRLGTHDATFYGGLKHATTLNRFLSSLFKLGSVPQEFNSRNTKSENMRNHFCSEDLVRLFQSEFSVSLRADEIKLWLTPY